MKLFRKNIEPRCAYCARGARIDDGHVACVKRGVVADTDKCPAFCYDPLRRMPSRPAELNTSRLSPEDFQV